MPTLVPIGRPYRTGLLAAAALATLLGACGDALQGADPSPARDAGVLPPPKTPINRLREDFDNRRLIESITSAVLDVNRGALTLDVVQFPTLDGEGSQRVDGLMQRNGLVEAADIVVSASGSITASDSVELRAKGTVTIGGDVRVGPGGMTIVAGDGIEILDSAVIDSRGPVRLMVADPDGTIVMDGRILVRATGESTVRPDIELLGRGSILVRGQITTDADEGQVGGDVTFSVYDEVQIVGAKARISAYARSGGTAGTVRIRTNSEVQLTGGAAIGRDRGSPSMIDAERAGAIEVQGGSIIVDDYSRISSNDSDIGGSVDLLARDLIRAGEGAVIAAGDGQVGGRLTLKAGRIELGVNAIVTAGKGITVAGDLQIDAIARISIEPAALVRAGDAGCGRGGDVRINVSGNMTVSAPAMIIAGDGATAFDEHSCGRVQPGGNVEVVVHEMVGVQEASRAGYGDPDGTIDVRLDSLLSITPVKLAVRTSGVVLSIPLERDVSAIGLIPRVVDVAMDAPTGTSVVVELTAAETLDGEYTRWIAIGSDDAKELIDLANARWFRYRVTLEGRAFDAPVLDYFDIDLAPSY